MQIAKIYLLLVKLVESGSAIVLTVCAGRARHTDTRANLRLPTDNNDDDEGHCWVCVVLLSPRIIFENGAEPLRTNLKFTPCRYERHIRFN